LVANVIRIFRERGLGGEGFSNVDFFPRVGS